MATTNGVKSGGLMAGLFAAGSGFGSAASKGEANGTVSPAAASSTAPTPLECLYFAASVLVGYRVEVQVKSGAVFEGVFHAMQFDEKAGDGMHLVLKYAKTLRDPAAKLADREAVAEKPFQTFVVKAQDLVQVCAKDVKLSPEDLANVQAPDNFDTDAAIGRGRGGAYGRELQKWTPEGPDDSSKFHLEASGAGWDQFAVNQAMFGVTTTFDEDLYTTNLNKNQSLISEREADRLAREIEASSASSGHHNNRHVAEERNALVDDSGLDEEDKYSSVLGVRQQVVPPAGALQLQQQQQPPPAQQQYLHPNHYQQQQHQSHFHPQQYPGIADSTKRSRPQPDAFPLGPSRSAWGTSGVGIAVVAGRGRALGGGHQHGVTDPSQRPSGAPADYGSRGGGGAPSDIPLVIGFNPPPPPPPPPPGRASSNSSTASSMSSPIDIAMDPRREANKLRQQLAGQCPPSTTAGAGVSSVGKDSRLSSSPYGSAPKGPKPPFTSPLVGDAMQIVALDLNPGTTNFDPDTRAEFARFKAAQVQERVSSSPPTDVIAAGLNRRDAELIELRNFSSSFKPPKASSGFAVATAADAATAAKAASDKAAAAAAGGAAIANTSAAATATSVKATATAAPTPIKDAADKPSTSATTPSKPFTFNVNAKAFSLNISAKPFTPGASLNLPTPTPSTSASTPIPPIPATAVAAAPTVPVVSLSPLAVQPLPLTGPIAAAASASISHPIAAAASGHPPPHAPWQTQPLLPQQQQATPHAGTSAFHPNLSKHIGHRDHARQQQQHMQDMGQQQQQHGLGHPGQPTMGGMGGMMPQPQWLMAGPSSGPQQQHGGGGGPQQQHGPGGGYPGPPPMMAGQGSNMMVMVPPGGAFYPPGGPVMMPAGGPMGPGGMPPGYSLYPNMPGGGRPQYHFPPQHPQQHGWMPPGAGYGPAGGMGPPAMMMQPPQQQQLGGGGGSGGPAHYERLMPPERSTSSGTQLRPTRASRPAPQRGELAQHHHQQQSPLSQQQQQQPEATPPQKATVAAAPPPSAVQLPSASAVSPGATDA